MQGKNKYPKLSPVSDAEMTMESPTKLSRRSFLEKTGMVAISLIAGVHTTHNLDQIISAERWRDDSIEIIAAHGSESLPKGGDEWLVFGGFGQKYSTNAAQELFTALGNNQVVSSVKYPNQGFTIEALSEIVAAYIANRGMKTLNIAGVSMGLPTALMTLQTIQSNAPKADSAITALSRSRIVPEINYLAAYSSPADLHDAMDGDLATLITSLSNQTGYQPGMVAKFLYSMLDGDGDARKTMHIQDQRQWWRHIRDSIEQTLNDTPPQLVLSQIKIISAFNVERQWSGLRFIVTPGNTKFIYCAPSNHDSTVNNATAAAKYKSALTRLSVPMSVIDTGPSGHANTVASAQAIGALLASAQVLGQYDSTDSG